MLYRSPVVRWILASMGVLAGCVLTFGDGAKWRATPSLHWLAQAPIPLQAWGVAMIAYGLLLLFKDTRPLGYATGATLWALFAISIVATLSDSGPKSILAVAAFVDVTVFHVFSVRTAWAARLAE